MSRITLIWVMGHGEVWLHGAWDEETIDDNPSLFDEAYAKAVDAHGARWVRLQKVKVPNVLELFETPEVEAKEDA